MGLISISNLNEILEGARNALSKMYDNIEKLSVQELYLVIVILGQFLYAKYATNGTSNGKEYVIYPDTVRDAIDNKSWASYAFKLITARNMICHEFGTSEMTSYVNRFTSNPKQIKRFLKYLGFGEETKEDDSEVNEALDRLLKSASIS